MLDAKEAARQAKEYFTTLYGNEGSGARLEEVELTDDGRHWMITLSVPARDQISWDLIGKRDYKIFKIAADTGEVKSMRIRKVE